MGWTGPRLARVYLHEGTTVLALLPYEKKVLCAISSLPVESTRSSPLGAPVLNS